MSTELFSKKHWLDIVIHGCEEILQNANLSDFPEFVIRYQNYRAERAYVVHQIAFYFEINYQAVVSSYNDQNKTKLYHELMYYYRYISMVEHRIVRLLENSALI